VFREPPSLRVAIHHSSAFTTVVEVVSEDSRIRDHVEKPREYVAAGIPEYWIVDEHETDPTDGMLSVFRLELTDTGPRYVLRERRSVKELLASG
jgi:Uma2 family endonuclease